MYKITYQKRNGEIIDRIRNTLPAKNIGEETSMGWIIVDIKYFIKDDYYSFRDYKQLLHKQTRYNHIHRNIKLYLKKYSTILTLIIFVPLYLIK